MTRVSHHVRPSLQTALICALLFAGTMLLFSRGLGYDFSNYDDPSYVTNNGHVQAGFTADSLRWAFTGHADYWHPLTWLSHMLDWQLYGDNAAGHHLTSVLWHALNAVLAFAVLRRLTSFYWTSAFAAALFAWHPLRVESVVWITERKDVMSGCFFLLTVWAYAAYVKRRETPVPGPATPAGGPRRGGSGGFYLLTLALFLASLMCKPMMVALPAMLLLLDVWPLNRIELSPSTPGWWRRAGWLLVEKVPFLALSAVISVITVLMQQHQGAFVLQLSFSARLANALVSVARYLGKFFWPFELAVAYPHPGQWPLFAVLSATVLVLLLTVVGVWQRRRQPWLLVGWLGFLVTLLPAIGLLQVGFQAMADRYTYVPVLALQLGLLCSLPGLPGLRALDRRIVAAAAVALLLGCALRTWDQQRVWRDPITLFTHALAVTDRNDVAHAFLGYTFIGQGRVEEAVTHSQRSLAINPRNETALFTLAGAHERRGDFAAAEATYRTILQLNPDDWETHFQLGLLLLGRARSGEAQLHLRAAAAEHPELMTRHLDQGFAHTLAGRPKLALAQFDVARAIKPDDPRTLVGSGLALSQLERTEEAIRAHRAALALQPDYPEAHLELGLLLLAQDQPREAEEHFRAALSHRPEFGLAHFGLGRAAEQQNRPDEAMASFEQAAALAPGNSLVHQTVAQAWARRRQFDRAVHHYQRAIELQPRQAGLYAELGYALVLSGRRAEGVQAWRTALELDPQLPGLQARLEQYSAP